jgi:hypothetical protein
LEAGFQLCLILLGCHAINVRRTIPDHQAIILDHPCQVDWAMQRGQHRVTGFPRLLGYPLPFVGEVFETRYFPDLLPVNGS